MNLSKGFLFSSVSWLFPVIATLSVSCRQPSSSQGSAATDTVVATNAEKIKDGSKTFPMVGDVNSSEWKSWQELNRGGDSSGGGPSIVCRNPDKTIVSVSLLDLYEAQILYGLKLNNSNDTVDHQVSAVSRQLAELNLFLGYDFDAAITSIRTNVKWFPDGVVINPGSDIGNDHAVPVPNGCTIELVGFYESTGRLVISKTLFDHLSLTEQAAFYVHEALYKIARSRVEAQNSGSTRKLNGYLFAISQSAEVIKPLLKDFTWEEYNSDEGSKDFRGPLLIPNETNLEFKLEIISENRYSTGLEFACYQNGNLQYGYITRDPEQIYGHYFLSLSASKCQQLRILAPKGGSDNQKGVHARLFLGKDLIFESSDKSMIYWAEIYHSR